MYTSGSSRPRREPGRAPRSRSAYETNPKATPSVMLNAIGIMTIVRNTGMA